MKLRDKIALIIFQHCLPDGIHNGPAADAILELPEIADLQKKLAEVEAERDALHNWREMACNERDAAEAAEAKLAEVERQHALDVIDAVNAQDRFEILAEFYVLKRAECEATETAIPHAYQMGLDAAAPMAKTCRQTKLSSTLRMRVRQNLILRQMPTLATMKFQHLREGSDEA